MNFYKHLNYSLGNEDWSVEEQALRIMPGDHAVCVTASGDRPLHLLMTECSQITTIDMNPVQNHLLDLKLTAINMLDFKKYLAFMGAEKSKHRLDIFREIKSHLSVPAAQCWSKRKKMIKNGIIYQGRTERLTYYCAKLIKLFRHTKIKTLFSFTDLAEQQEYVQTHWDTPAWRKTFEVLLHPSISKFILNDPGLNGYKDDCVQPGRYIYDKMLQYLNYDLARKSVLMQLLFTGTVMPEAFFPYLTFEGYQKIRRHADRLTIKTGNIIDYLSQHASDRFDAFSMSDIASYMPQVVFDQLMQAMLHSARPSARFCVREFMSKREIDTKLQPHFVRNTMLETKLEKEESNFVYRFMVGEIQK